MANLEETREWAEGIYQLEKTDRVLGGTDGVANRQGQQLANRTLWLKEKVESTESALTEHEEADDPHPQYVTEQEMTDYVGTVIVQGQVNADWNATSGAAEILNKPTAMTGATAETAGKQGFVPAPQAGDEEKVLTGSGEWKHVSGIAIGQEVMHYGSTPPPGCLVCDGSAVGRATYPKLYAVIGTTYGEGDGETTFNLPNRMAEPPALTLLPCIKAFDAFINPGLIDITELANEVAGKADTNLSNLSATGKAKVASLAMPSDNYVDLTPPQTGADYVFTAPADGYVCFRVMATEAYQNLTLSVDQIASANQAASASYWMSATIPVRKGKRFACQWSGGDAQYFRFYYAEGSQP